MRFAFSASCLVLATVATAGRVSAQSADARLVKLAVAEVLKADDLQRNRNMYRNQRIVLDTSRLAIVLDETGSIRPDRRPPLPRSAMEMKELASWIGIGIASGDDAIRCAKIVYRCVPFNVTVVKLGDPRVVEDSAYVVYRLTTVSGPPGWGGLSCGQGLLTIRRDSSGWRPITRRSAMGDKPGWESPILAIRASLPVEIRPAGLDSASIVALRDPLLPPPLADSVKQSCPANTR